MSPMSPRLRKLLGSLALLLFLLVYAAVVATLASSERFFLNPWVEFLFYFVAGLAWVPPAAALIWWMEQRKD